MNCANKAGLVLLVVVTLGVWGCAQGTGPGPGSARMRDLESRHTKLEEDYRATVTARDLAHKRVAALEQEKGKLQQHLAQLTRERDELRQQAAARAAERDAVQNQLAQFGKDLHSLVGRIDAAVGLQQTTPVSTTGPTLATEKS